MDDGIKRITRSIEAYGLWFRLALMLALAAACLLAMQRLKIKDKEQPQHDIGSREELERLLRAELPMKFSEIIIAGEVSPETAGELYRQHHAGFEILNWRHDPAGSSYGAEIKLSWWPDMNPGPKEDFWVLAKCSLNKRGARHFDFKVIEVSPDYNEADRGYQEVLMKYWKTIESGSR